MEPARPWSWLEDRCCRMQQLVVTGPQSEFASSTFHSHDDRLRGRNDVEHGVAGDGRRCDRATGRKQAQSRGVN